MHLPARSAADGGQKPPKRIGRKGKTVLLKKAVVTNAGQTATAKVTWSTKKSAMGNKGQFCVGDDQQKVTIRPYWKAKKFYV